MTHQQTQDFEAVLAAWSFVALISLAIGIVLSIVINWKIASKAGYDGALSLLMLIPVANVVFLMIFAFSKWPVVREVEAYRNGGQPPALW